MEGDLKCIVSIKPTGQVWKKSFMFSPLVLLVRYTEICKIVANIVFLNLNFKQSKSLILINNNHQ